MSYAIRNSIIIAALLILILSINAVWRSNTMKKLESEKKIFNAKSKELADLKRVNPDLEKEKEIMAQHDSLQRKALKRTKFIVQEDNSILTYDYITKLTKTYCPGFNFDFQTLDGGSIYGTTFNKYKIYGSTNLKDFYTFICQLEKQSPLCIIESLNFGEEPVDSKSGSGKKMVIKFEMEFSVFYDKNGKPYEELALRDIKRKYLSENPFTFKLHEPDGSNIDPSLVKIDGAKIIGITEDNILLKAGQNEIVYLEIGDEVAHGYLDEIVYDEKYAVFKINQIGIVQNKKLYLEKE